ncbi:unnamed protein product [Gongylonema pulchrum]|uniref:HpcH_HpaI domain-containing protein n=1 Tax=Gongylonema pulchrum TaxID=637853 RepID=A0A183E6G9_9BILA|nr:unnamed protein product [Gongylonema pulchrum]
MLSCFALRSFIASLAQSQGTVLTHGRRAALALYQRSVLVQGQRAAGGGPGAGDGDSSRSYIPRRALLYVPASSSRMLSKVAQIKADCVVLELEDGVALSAKAEARRNVREYLDALLEKGPHQCYELGVRINSVASGLLCDDIGEVAGAKHLPDAFMVPKVDSVDDLAVIYGAFRAAYGDERIKNSVNCSSDSQPNDHELWLLCIGDSIPRIDSQVLNKSYL